MYINICVHTCTNYVNIQLSGIQGQMRLHCLEDINCVLLLLNFYFIFPSFYAHLSLTHRFLFSYIFLTHSYTHTLTHTLTHSLFLSFSLTHSPSKMEANVTVAQRYSDVLKLVTEDQVDVRYPFSLIVFFHYQFSNFLFFSFLHIVVVVAVVVVW